MEFIASLLVSSSRKRTMQRVEPVHRDPPGNCKRSLRVRSEGLAKRKDAVSRRAESKTNDMAYHILSEEDFDKEIATYERVGIALTAVLPEFVVEEEDSLRYSSYEEYLKNVFKNYGTCGMCDDTGQVEDMPDRVEAGDQRDATFRACPICK